MTGDPPQRRVVITGMGVVTAAGLSLQSFWDNVRLGISGAGPLTRFDAKNSPTTIAAEVKNFDGRKYLNSKTAKWLDRSHQFSVAAAVLAAKDSKLDVASMDPDLIGVVEGCSVGNVQAAIEATDQYLLRGFRAVSPFAMVNGHLGAGSGEIAVNLGIKGHAITLSTGSASGNDAIGYGLNMIKSGEVDVMVAGGAEAPVVPSGWGSLCRNKVMTRHNQMPESAMRPFDRSRDGFVLGEGAGYVVLEELSHALSRDASIYAELVSYGRSCEAFHPVAPHPEGVGIYRAMEKALRNGDLALSEIDYVNAHGTATEANDVSESRAIRRLFGGDADRIAVSSTKPITGHLMAAAGAVETIVCALAIHHEIIPLTLNFRDPADDCTLDYVRDVSRPYPIRTAMNLSSGFGGKNACLIVRKYRAGR